MDEIRFDENGLIMRPRRRDGIVRRRAAEMALPKVKGWMGADTGGSSDKGIIEGLMKHIDHSDGYEIAKSLDGDGWNCDSMLVEIMDEDFISDAERELVAQWVKCLGVKLDIPIGAKVICRGQTGIVVTHDEALARYGVRTPDLKDGQRWMCDAEDVKLAVEMAA